jgi:uncharacterized damage-inducible protein DinB
LVLLFDDTDLALTPGPGAMSLEGQLAHLAAASEFTVDLLEQEHPTRDGFRRIPEYARVYDACRDLVRLLRRVQSASSSMTGDRWEERLATLGGEWCLPRRELAFLMEEHSVHHTGALHVYARLAGKVPPKIYSPVDESLLVGLE